MEVFALLCVIAIALVPACLLLLDDSGRHFYVGIVLASLAFEACARPGRNARLVRAEERNLVLSAPR